MRGDNGVSDDREVAVRVDYGRGKEMAMGGVRKLLRGLMNR